MIISSFLPSCELLGLLVILFSLQLSVSCKISLYPAVLLSCLFKMLSMLSEDLECLDLERRGLLSAPPCPAKAFGKYPHSLSIDVWKPHLWRFNLYKSLRAAIKSSLKLQLASLYLLL